MIYLYPALDQSAFPAPKPIGSTVTAADVQAVTRATTVLSNMRWSSTVVFPPGGTFSSGQIVLYCPMGSTGRFAPQAILQSPNSVTATGLRIQTMNAGSTYTSFTGTASNITNPTDLRGTAGGTWRCSARMYAGSSTYGLLTNGCSRLTLYGVTGSTPLGLSVIDYPYPGYSTSTSSAYVGWRYDKRNTLAWPDLPFTPLTAGWARTIEDALEVAEAMPVIIGMLPEVSGVTGLPAWDVPLLRRVMTKQIPLARPRRPKALFLAVHSSTTANPSISMRVGAQLIQSWTTVYSSGAYRVYKARLFDEAYFSASEAGGVPIVNVELLSFSLTPLGATAWITEDF